MSCTCVRPLAVVPLAVMQHPHALAQCCTSTRSGHSTWATVSSLAQRYGWGGDAQWQSAPGNKTSPHMVSPGMAAAHLLCNLLAGGHHLAGAQAEAPSTYFLHGRVPCAVYLRPLPRNPTHCRRPCNRIALPVTCSVHCEHPSQRVGLVPAPAACTEISIH